MENKYDSCKIYMIELNSGKYSLKLTRIWYIINLPSLWPEQVYNDNTLYYRYPHLCAEYTNRGGVNILETITIVTNLHSLKRCHCWSRIICWWHLMKVVYQYCGQYVKRIIIVKLFYNLVVTVAAVKILAELNTGELIEVMV